MSHAATLQRQWGARETAPAPVRSMDDDKAMLLAAADVTRALNAPKPAIYWADLIGSAIVGYAALAAAMVSPTTAPVVVSGIIAIVALYRAGSFIHELTHIKKGAIPGFRLAWNLLIGIPLLLPSFLYEGVHNQHHAKRYYGTADDPEYLPLALMKPWTLPLFMLVAVLSPVMLLVRFAVLAPLSLLSTRLRIWLVGRYSGLQINPFFRRSRPEGDFARQWAWQETAASVWAITIIVVGVLGLIPLHDFVVLFVIASGVMFINQIRTLVAHLWENDGEPMSVTEQYLDSVNVPPPATLPVLWAPVGLRYHALHHLLPGLPYHALGEAHRRLCTALGQASPYHAASHRRMSKLVARLAASSLRTAQK